MKRLVLFVEGQGDELAVQTLVRRLISEHSGWDCIIPDSRPFRVGGLSHLIQRPGKQDDWLRWLRAAQKRPNFGGVLLLLDGDIDSIGGRPFCARLNAAELVQRAISVGAGVQFSVAVVFACCEFESWLIAGVKSLAGRPLPPDNRPGIPADVEPPDGDLEEHPRGAKEWLSRQIDGGYDPLHFLGKRSHEGGLTDGG
jgi:hypothetical protein